MKQKVSGFILHELRKHFQTNQPNKRDETNENFKFDLKKMNKSLHQKII